MVGEKILGGVCRVAAGGGNEILSLELDNGGVFAVAAPVFNLEGMGRMVAMPNSIERLAPPRQLPNGVIEHRLGGPLSVTGMRLEMDLRVAADCAVVRFRYRLFADTPARLSRPGGHDDLAYAAAAVPAAAEVRMVELSVFNELGHCYHLRERVVPPRALRHGACEVGPIATVAADGATFLLAYEHGSTANDPFLRFDLGYDAGIVLRAVKGNYCHGEEVSAAAPYQTLWLQAGGVAGGIDDLAAAYRRFVLERFALFPASRRPLVFYNTWNNQERDHHRRGNSYNHDMTAGRIAAEIDVAAAMGIDVFVLDTGWYEKTGDWNHSSERFPDGLEPIRGQLEAHGMRLGLWFGPLHAAVTSECHREFRDCLATSGGAPGAPHPIWETEESQNFCVASRFGDAFAAKLAEANRRLGVTYFKWDAIGQYGCDAPGHGHGGAENTPSERRDRYAFMLPLRMVEIVEKLAESCPEAIVDFDVTEGGRAVGLAFLAAGKYFLINNGPYFPNYDMKPPGTDNNMMMSPGEARPWICRQALDFDRWIPSILHLVHYFPDDPAPAPELWLRPSGFADSLQVNLASLILGHNGIWGDLLAVGQAGVARIRRTLDRYKLVRDAVTAANPVRMGMVGASPEIHEKLLDGRGVVVVFATMNGEYQWITSRPVGGDPWWDKAEMGNTAKVERLADGHARITVEFTRPGARVVFWT